MKIKGRVDHGMCCDQVITPVSPTAVVVDGGEGVFQAIQGCQ